MSLVSVVIPCHNYARYLAECIESVLSQGVATELLVVDDSSTDSPEVVARQFGVPCIRVEHGNPHDTRRHGFHQTAAPFACFLDADDKLGVGYLPAALKALEPPDVGIAYSALFEFGDSHRRFRCRAGNIEQGNFIHSGSVYRRQAIVDCRVFDFPLEDPNDRFEDWWLARHVLHGPYRAVWHNGKYLYRKHGHGRSDKHKQVPGDKLYCRDLKPIWERA